MANQDHLNVLKQGVKVWNEWRNQHYEFIADLTNIPDELKEANLSEVNFTNTNLDWTNLWQSDLSKANLSYTGFIRTNLQEANLNEANLSSATMAGAFLEGATLKKAILRETNLTKADLSGVDLSGADLSRANLFEANLSGTLLSYANLEGANLAKALLDRTNLTGANLLHCSVYGVSAWNVQLTDATQRNLIVTLPNEPVITVDELEVAQFIYLLLNNQKIRDVIDTITSKVVLILGRFTPERKAVLDALREALRTHGYIPILFDFEKPGNRNLTETVRTLAHLSRFIIADLTDPSSIPQELQAIVPTLAVPVQPVLLEGKKEYAMFVDFLKTYHWVLPTHFYTDQAHLLTTLKEQVIAPAEQKAQELEKR